MKLIIIEDDMAVATCLKEFFELAGHACEVYLDPREAVTACRNGGYDVILTDIRMPGMDGIQVLEAIRAFNPKASVCLMTGFADVENAIEAVNNGAYAFFRKPLDLKTVLATIRKIEREKSANDPGSAMDSELVKLCLEYKNLEDSIRERDNSRRRV